MPKPALWPSHRVRRGFVWDLTTGEKTVQVYISDGGKSIRLWDADKKAPNGRKGVELT
jgi:hypothetical protein